jgi:hypothetical protein
LRVGDEPALMKKLPEFTVRLKGWHVMADEFFKGHRVRDAREGLEGTVTSHQESSGDGPTMPPRSLESQASISSDAVQQIAAQLQMRLGKDVRNLRVIPHAEGLILLGRADTYYAKQLAQHLAMEISGRAIQANEIEVG